MPCVPFPGINSLPCYRVLTVKLSLTWGVMLQSSLVWGPDGAA